MRGIVALKNIQFQAYHGATAAERRSLRRFQVDVQIALDLAKPATSDRLADAVDYQQLSELVVLHATEKTYRLLEALAGALVHKIAESWPTADITVEVRKLHPPCAGNPDYSSVTLSSLARERAA